MNWYTAVAFTRWLSSKLNEEISLPTEAEWWLAATRNDPQRVYPWGPDWNANYANTGDGSLGRTTAVGMFPGGAAATMALDMSGNVREWCLNDYKEPAQVRLDSEEWKALRGGRYSSRASDARAVSRSDYPPDYDHGGYGFRVVVRSSPFS